MKMRGQLNIFLFILILLLPAYSEAAYKIYLKNGSVIEGVGSYEKRDGEVILNIGRGNFGISEKEILKIEETEALEKDFSAKELPEEEKTRGIPYDDSTIAEKGARVNALKADLEAINSELKAVEENEAGIKASIDEQKRVPRRTRRYPNLDQNFYPLVGPNSSGPPFEWWPSWDEQKRMWDQEREKLRDSPSPWQRWRHSRQLIIEKEQELSKIQDKKAELLQQRDLIEYKLRSLE
jgi:hypothetical protein